MLVHSGRGKEEEWAEGVGGGGGGGGEEERGAGSGGCHRREWLLLSGHVRCCHLMADPHVRSCVRPRRRELTGGRVAASPRLICCDLMNQ